MLTCIPLLTNSLQGSTVKLLDSAVELLQDATCTIILDKLDKYISEDITFGVKMNAQQAIHNLVFAVKPGINGLLDVARATFCETVEEIHSVFSTMLTFKHLMTNCYL